MSEEKLQKKTPIRVIKKQGSIIKIEKSNEELSTSFEESTKKAPVRVIKKVSSDKKLIERKEEFKEITESFEKKEEFKEITESFENSEENSFDDLKEYKILFNIKKFMNVVEENIDEEEFLTFIFQYENITKETVSILKTKIS
jgi:hypothetical protein